MHDCFEIPQYRQGFFGTWIIISGFFHGKKFEKHWSKQSYWHTTAIAKVPPSGWFSVPYIQQSRDVSISTNYSALRFRGVVSIATGSAVLTGSDDRSTVTACMNVISFLRIVMPEGFFHQLMKSPSLLRIQGHSITSSQLPNGLFPEGMNKSMFMAFYVQFF